MSKPSYEELAQQLKTLQGRMSYQHIKQLEQEKQGLLIELANERLKTFVVIKKRQKRMRVCSVCGRLRLHKAHGKCTSCYMSWYREQKRLVTSETLGTFSEVTGYHEC